MFGSHETYDTHNLLNQLTQVQMPRAEGTQTRTFNYDLATGRLTGATNPENGTVSYTYNGDGTLASKTDAKGQRIAYGYDEFMCVTQKQVFPDPGNPSQEDFGGWGGWGRRRRSGTVEDHGPLPVMSPEVRKHLLRPSPSLPVHAFGSSERHPPYTRPKPPFKPRF